MPKSHKGEDIVLGWRELLSPASRPEGYSTTREIAEATSRCVSSVQKKVLKLRKAGRIEAIHCIINGSLSWVYKD